MKVYRTALLTLAFALGIPPLLIGCDSDLSQAAETPAGASEPPRTPNITFDPSHPEASGYHEVFGDNFHSLSTIDIHDTRAQSYKWFVHPFFSGKLNPKLSITSRNGAVVLQNGSISTAAPGIFGHTVVGRGFAGGGYFEVTYSEGPRPASPKGYPAFWSMALEHLSGDGRDRDYTGKDQGTRYIEDDFSERDTAFADPNSYAASMIEWYGHWRQDCPATQYCRTWNHGSNGLNNWILHPGADVSWQMPHRVGQLWSPATANTKGFVQNYFDGHPIGTPVTWDNNINTPYEVMDHEHIAVFFQAGDQPMILQNFAVWQR